MRRRLAFDLDETLGTAVTDGYSLCGFNLRKGCCSLLEELSKSNEIVLWTASNRNYLDKALYYTKLGRYFIKTYAWEDVPQRWKDVRTLNVDFLIDDSEHHRQCATQFGITSRYIIVPAYGSKEDIADELLWINVIKEHLAG